MGVFPPVGPPVEVVVVVADDEGFDEQPARINTAPTLTVPSTPTRRLRRDPFG
jgi:hypothetical protein